MQCFIFHKKYGNILVKVHALDRFAERAWKAGLKLEDDVLGQLKKEFEKSARVTEHNYDSFLRKRGKEKEIFFENDVFRFVIQGGFLRTVELLGKYEPANKHQYHLTCSPRSARKVKYEHLHSPRRSSFSRTRFVREARYQNVFGIRAAFADLFPDSSFG